MKGINTEKYLHFRKVSVYFYIFSFFCIVASFIIFLYANKNNRSCQYGSTLFCSTDTKYPINFKDASASAYQIEFYPYNPIDKVETTINFPFFDTIDNEEKDFYIDYYFGTSGGDTVDTINSYIGISVIPNVGASLYFQPVPSSNFDVQLKNITEFILETSNEFINIIDSTEGDNFLEYYINTDEDSQISPPNQHNFYSSKNIKIDKTDPLNSNWVNLLTNFQNQKKYGCSPGNQKACACADPSIVSNKPCNEYHLNPLTGFYCPATHPGCSTLCGVNSTKEDNCGYTFCNPSGVNEDKAATKFYKFGTYNSNYIDGLRNPDNSDIYKLGIAGPKLIGGLNNLDENNFTGSKLKNYPSYQLNNFCAGKKFGKNNFDNNDLTSVTDQFPDTYNNDSYNPLLSQFPNFEEGKQFDF